MVIAHYTLIEPAEQTELLEGHFCHSLACVYLQNLSQ